MIGFRLIEICSFLVVWISFISDEFRKSSAYCFIVLFYLLSFLRFIFSGFLWLYFWLVFYWRIRCIFMLSILTLLFSFLPIESVKSFPNYLLMFTIIILLDFLSCLLFFLTNATISSSCRSSLTFNVTTFLLNILNFLSIIRIFCLTIIFIVLRWTFQALIFLLILLIQLTFILTILCWCFRFFMLIVNIAWLFLLSLKFTKSL